MTNIRHGHTNKFINSKGNCQVRQSTTYTSWRAARQKCLCKSYVSYPQNGGIGISISEDWSDFRVFLKDMGRRPIGKALYRLDPSGDYNKENCKWMSSCEYAKYRRSR